MTAERRAAVSNLARSATQRMSGGPPAVPSALQGSILWKEWSGVARSCYLIQHLHLLPLHLHQERKIAQGMWKTAGGPSVARDQAQRATQRMGAGPSARRLANVA